MSDDNIMHVQIRIDNAISILLAIIDLAVCMLIAVIIRNNDHDFIFHVL